MKVLFITVWKPRVGGIVTRVENIVSRLQGDYSILTYKNGPNSSEAGVVRVPYMDLPVIRALTFTVFSIIKGLRMDFDLIHAHYALPQGFVGAALKAFKKKPLVLTVHGSDILVLGSNPAVRPLLKTVLGRCDRIIAVSQRLRDRLIELGVEEEKIKVIYSGAPSVDRAKGEGERLVFIGALVPQKGVETLLKAYQKVKKSYENLQLVVVGDGPQRNILKKLSKDLALKGVEFRGYVEDIDEELTARSILVLPSRSEGFGLTLLEAMARGVPVVASRTGGIQEIVEDGVNGLLFYPGDHKGLSKAVQRIMMDENLRQRLINEGLSTARRFSWDRTVEEIKDVYEELTGKGA